MSDFSTFVITGPSTSSVSVGKMLAGEFNPDGEAVADATQCLTDTFSITNQVSVPVICGTNTGYHGKLGLKRTGHISFLTGQDRTGPDTQNCFNTCQHLPNGYWACWGTSSDKTTKIKQITLFNVWLMSFGKSAKFENWCWMSHC